MPLALVLETVLVVPPAVVPVEAEQLLGEVPQTFDWLLQDDGAGTLQLGVPVVVYVFDAALHANTAEPLLPLVLATDLVPLLAVEATLPEHDEPLAIQPTV